MNDEMKFITPEELIENQRQTNMTNKLIEMLKEGETIVQFTKVNGDKRIMHATLNETLMVNVPVKKTDTTRKTNDDVIAVWDLTAKGWRSFRKDSVKFYEKPIEHKTV